MTADLPIYFGTYQSLRESGRYRFKIFVESLEFESGYRERLSLFEDIVTGNTSNLRHIFSDSSLEDLASFAFTELTSLPKETIRANRDLFNIILEYALNGKYPEKDKVLRRLYAIFAQQPGAFEIRYMLNVIFDPRMSEDFRILFTLVLISMDDAAIAINWANYDLKQNNFLIPGYILHNSRTNAMEALRSLKNADPAFLDRHIARFEYPIQKALETLAAGKGNSGEVMDIALDINADALYKIITENSTVDPRIGSYLAIFDPEEIAVPYANELKKDGGLKDKISAKVEEANENDADQNS